MVRRPRRMPAKQCERSDNCSDGEDAVRQICQLVLQLGCANNLRKGHSEMKRRYPQGERHQPKDHHKTCGSSSHAANAPQQPCSSRLLAHHQLHCLRCLWNSRMASHASLNASGCRPASRANWSSDGDERATLAVDVARWRIATPRSARHEARATCGSHQRFGHASKTDSRVASDRNRTIGPACVPSKHPDGHHQQHEGEKAERRLDPDPIQGAGRCVEPMAERGA